MNKTSNEALLCLDKKIYDGDVMSDISEDFILPDYLPDIRRIVSVTPVIRRDAFYAGQDKLDYDGTVYYNIIYVSENGDLKNIIYKTPFSGSAAIKGLTEESVVDLDFSPTGINVRLSNPRKVGIRARPTAHITAYERVCAEPDLDGELGAETGESLQMQSSSEDSLSICIAEDKGIAVSEDAEIPSDMPPIGEIVSVFITPGKTEAVISGDNILCRFDAAVRIFYRAAGEDTASRYMTYVTKLPLSHTVEAPGAGEDCAVSADVTIYDVAFAAAGDTAGENRIVELDFLYDVKTVAVENERQDFISDMYSVHYNSIPTYNNMELKSLKKHYSTNFSISETVPKSAAACDFDKILFASSAVSSCNVKQSGSRLIVDGDIDLHITGAKDQEIEAWNATVPYRAELDYSGGDDDFEYKINCKVQDTGVRLSDEQIRYDGELFVDMMVFGKKEIPVIRALHITKEPTESPSLPVTLYYPASTDTLWSIAKKYNTTKEKLRAVNKLDGDHIAGKHVLIIPGAGK